MKSALFAAATPLLAAGPALAGENVSEPGGIGALLVLKAFRK